jgi:predicted phosphodiesterase
MLIALLADIHANREALTACLAEAERAGVERYVFLGDLVGYGADPCWVLDRVAEMVEAAPSPFSAITMPRPSMAAKP